VQECHRAESIGCGVAPAMSVINLNATASTPSPPLLLMPFSCRRQADPLAVDAAPSCHPTDGRATNQALWPEVAETGQATHVPIKIPTQYQHDVRTEALARTFAH
jgi:hypothetical protein